MNSSYSQYHKVLIQSVFEKIRQSEPFSLEELLDSEQHFIDALEELSQDPNNAEQGQWLVSTIVSRYPQFTALMPRDLFWFFGGDCLHFLGDEEIADFQSRDEDFYEQNQQDPSLNFSEYIQSEKVHTIR